MNPTTIAAWITENLTENNGIISPEVSTLYDYYNQAAQAFTASKHACTGTDETETKQLQLNAADEHHNAAKHAQRANLPLNQKLHTQQAQHHEQQAQ